MSLPATQLKLVHLQLTAQCNLRCRFCGQWGEHGYRCLEKSEPDLSWPEWRRVIDQAAALAAQGGSRPEFVVWGGEPLLSPCCGEVLNYLRENGFAIGLITNGLLLEQFADVINATVNTLYVSLDGIGEIHNRIRNCPGLYRRIMDGMARIDNRVDRVNLFTVCQDNYRCIPEYPLLLPDGMFDKIIYQNIIFTTSADAAAYREFLHGDFGAAARHVDSWITDSWEDYVNELPALLRQVEANRNQGRYHSEVVMFPEEVTPDNICDWYYDSDGVALNADRQEQFCLSPFRHLHVGAQGEVHGCVDFDDLVWGNVRTSSLAEIFNGNTAAAFRRAVAEGRNPLCKRCPWRYNTSLALDAK